MAEGILFWLAVLMLAAAVTGLFAGTASGRARWLGWGRAALHGALVPLGAALLIRWIVTGHGPYVTRHEVLVSDTWMLVAAAWVAARVWRPAAVAALAVAPVALLMLGVSAMVTPDPQAAPSAFDNVWLVVHVLFAKAAYGSFLVSGTLSGAALWRARRPGLPAEAGPAAGPVQLEEWSYRWMLAGFLFLGVMIAAGSLWAYHAWGRYWGWDPIECWALGTWLVYGVALHLRQRGWRGARFEWASVGALTVVVAAYFVGPTVSRSIHAGYFK